MARGGRFAMRAALPLAVAGAAYEFASDRTDAEKESGDMGDYYARLRREGRSRLGAGFSTLGKSLEAGLGSIGLVDETTVEGRARESMAGKTKVHPAGGGFMAPGGGYDEIAEAYGQVAGAGATADKTLGVLEDIRKLLEKRVTDVIAGEKTLDRPAGGP